MLDTEIVALIPTAAVLVGAREPYAAAEHICEKRAQLKRRVAVLRKKYGAKY